jgi:hypothetical protein
MRTPDMTLGLLKNNGRQLSAYVWGGNLRSVIASDQVVGLGKESF